MDNKELNTEQIILEAAEAEFLEKGYGNAKMMSIAKRAWVSHSMLHYYFRTKENLFQMIFQKKIQTISQLFEGIFDRHLPFFETVRLVVEFQFNFVAQNQKLPRFILNEILANSENRALLLDVLAPKIAHISAKIEKRLNEEIARGTVRPIKVSDLMMNVISINVSTFLALPILCEVSGAKDKDAVAKMLAERRESNVQFILNGLKP